MPTRDKGLSTWLCRKCKEYYYCPCDAQTCTDVRTACMELYGECPTWEWVGDAIKCPHCGFENHGC